MFVMMSPLMKKVMTKIKTVLHLHLSASVDVHRVKNLILRFMLVLRVMHHLLRNHRRE